MRRVLFVAALLAVTVENGFAQRLSNTERRRMNGQLLELVESYKNYSVLRDEDMALNFLDLFSDPEAKVFCDYATSFYYGQQISVRDYAEFSTRMDRIATDVRNVRKGEYEPYKGSYKVSVELDKSVRYEDELHSFFNTTDEEIGGDYHLTLNCWYNTSEKRFTILSIEGRKHENNTFPEGPFMVIQRKGPKDDALTYNGKPLQYNLYDQTIVPGTTPPTILDDDLIVTIHEVGRTDRYTKLNYSYKETRRRLRAYVQMAPVSAYSVTSDIAFSTNKSSEYGFGVDVGYAFPMQEKLKLAIYGGLGLSFSSLSLGVKDIQYTISCSQAVTFQQVDRNYTLMKVDEGLKFVDAVIPLYPSLEFRMNPDLILSVDAGFKLYLNMQTTVVPYTVAGSVEEINTVTGVRTESDLSGEINSYMSPASYARNTYDLVGFGRLGIDYRIAPRRCVFLRIGYAYGLTESYNSDLNPWFNLDEGRYPFVYSPHTDADVAVRSFADCISYRRAALTFDLGFRMNF